MTQLSQNGNIRHYLGNKTRYEIKTCRTPISAAFYYHESNLWFSSCSDPKMPRLSLVGSQNGLFGHYLGNIKRNDLETMLYPHKCGHSTSMKVTWGYHLVRFQTCPNWAQRVAKMAILAIILETKRDATLKPWSNPINAAIPLPCKWFGVLISFRSQNAQIEPNGQPKWPFGQYIGN